MPRNTGTRLRRPAIFFDNGDWSNTSSLRFGLRIESFHLGKTGDLYNHPALRFLKPRVNGSLPQLRSQFAKSGATTFGLYLLRRKGARILCAGDKQFLFWPLPGTGAIQVSVPSIPRHHISTSFHPGKRAFRDVLKPSALSSRSTGSTRVAKLT